MIDYKALLKLSYGMYIVSSGNREYGNGFVSNTVFQVTSEPPRFAVCCHKENHTAGIIRSAGAFAVSVLRQDAAPLTIGNFGFKSGSKVGKMSGMDVRYGDDDVPVLLNDALAYLEFRLSDTYDLGSHWMFMGELMGAEILDDEAEPLSYGYYRKEKRGLVPKNSPTYIDKSKLE